LSRRAISTFVRELGISTVSCRALFALRILVSMSAIGSVSIACSSPRRLGHAGDDAEMRQLAQADPAQAELLVHRARAAAAVAAAVLPRREALRPGGLRDHGLLGHSLLLPSLFGERQAEPAQQRVGGLVRLGRRRDRDVEAADRAHVVVVDLGEDDLLADADRVVAAAVERARVEAAEVADPRQRDRDEPVEELVHAGTAQRHPRADRHALAHLEAGDRLAGAAHLRPLPGDRRQLLDGTVERLRVRLRLAHAHVQRDLRHARHLHHRREAELFLQPPAELLLVGCLQAWRVGLGRGHPAHPLSISSPQSARRQTRTLTRSPLTSLNLTPTRVGRPQAGQTTITFETSIGAGFSITPPGWICGAPMRPESLIGRGFVCRLTMFRFSTTTRRSRGLASSTLPCLPRSLPLRIWTRSPFFTFSVVGMSSQHLRRERHDLHEVLLPELAGDGAEDARPARVPLVVDDHGGVLVEGDRGSVLAVLRLLRAHDHRAHDLALLDRPLRTGRLDRADDDVADTRVAPVRPAHDADAEQRTRARVVGDADSGLLLDHPRTLRAVTSPPR